MFKTSLFRILKEIKEDIAYLKWKQVINLENASVNMNQKIIENLKTE